METDFGEYSVFPPDFFGGASIREMLRFLRSRWSVEMTDILGASKGQALRCVYRDNCNTY